VRYLAHQKQMEALEEIPAIAADFETAFGRAAGGLLQDYRCDDAETVVVALGSINGTIQEVVDEARAAGAKIGSISIRAFRPFPLAALCDRLEGAKRVVCVEKSLAPGLGGILASNIRMALRGRTIPVYTVIAGLGGRVITRKSLAGAFERAGHDNLDDVTFLDLNWDVVHQQLASAREKRHSGPIAENLLKALNPGLVRRVSS
jgi:pyruvate ferredoxin oxidoreductase alpha subunit